ncbi:MAG: proline--tRNA ligase [Nanoarchaeota archaeon]|nr:proline--tRNA ligase [Nanoarchaeota archaeon]
MSEQEGITIKKAENFSEWYYEVLQKAELVDIRFNVKGFDVYMPTAVKVLREMEKLFIDELESRAHMPVMFPIIIPESNLKKEEEHIKGFSVEAFWITHAGKSKLDERLALRPTSETAMYPLYSLWLRSHTQLPMKFYQQGRVWRYETKMTRPLIRPREFKWFEAHCAQASEKEALKQVAEDTEIFEKVVRDYFSIPFIHLQKPSWDKFAGGENTFAFETVLPDGKILQIGTTHYLGQKFSKAFDVKYTDKDGKKKYVYQTCFGPGVSRILGAMVSIHGDDKGLIVPPTVAPVQIVIIPVFTKDTEVVVMKKAGELLGSLAEKGFRVDLDDRTQFRPGFKFHEAELKGVPIRIEIGPRDVEKGEVTIVRRDFLERISIPQEKVEEQVLEIMDSIGAQLLKRANIHLKIQDAKSIDEIRKKLKDGGFIRIDFCMNEKCDDELKIKTGTEVRGTLFGKKEKVGTKCAICGTKAKEKAYIGISY